MYNLNNVINDFSKLSRQKRENWISNANKEALTTYRFYEGMSVSEEEALRFHHELKTLKKIHEKLILEEDIKKEYQKEQYQKVDTMSYKAIIFNVMIASPGDVASERSIIREVIYEWNVVHSRARSIVLLPIGWETHSSPEMGGNPQEIINKQVLDKCDFLVGVFWTRIGTPTNNYASGTVEEIEKHIKAEKPAMLYFSSQPVVMDTVDLKQMAELKRFKESCQSRGLYEGYDSHADFKEKFYRHLQLKLNEHPMFAEIEPDSIGDIKKSNTQIPSLTNEARILLKEASLDNHGSIMHLRYMGGTDIQTNGKNLIQSKDRREIAMWEAALEELVNNELLIERGSKGEVFEITNLGYQIADMIQF